MKTKLETAAGLTTKDLFQNNSAQGRVDAIREEALAEVFDMTTDAGRKACISHAAKVTKTKTVVDKIGKALSDSLSVESKKVLAERKIYRDGLDKLKKEVRQPVTEWELAEAEKAEAVKKAFECLATNSETSNFTGQLFSRIVLEAKLERLENFEIDVFLDESDLNMAKDRIFAGKTKLRAAIQQSKDANELAELRKAQAERQEAEDKKAREAAIVAEAIARHEAAKAEDTGNTNQVAMDNFKRKIGMPRDQEESVVKNKLEINKTLIQAFCNAGGIEAGQARKILAEIQRGTIDNISINYD